MRRRAILMPLVGGLLGAVLVFAAVSVLSFGAFAQQIPTECLPFVSGGASGGGTSPSPDAWSPGPGAAGDNTFVGTIDAPARNATLPAGTPFLVSGWVVDKSAQGWAGVDQVQVYNGFMGSGGTLLATALVAQPRPDVGTALGNLFYAASGFVATVPANLPAGATTLNVYAHTPGKGWWYRSVSFTLSASTPAATSNAAPAANVGQAVTLLVSNPTQNDEKRRGANFGIDGQATDPNAPKGSSGVERVTVFLDNRDQGGRLLGEATPAADGSFHLNVTLPANLSGDRALTVYALSSISGRESMLRVPIRILDPDQTTS